MKSLYRGSPSRSEILTLFEILHSELIQQPSDVNSMMGFVVDVLMQSFKNKFDQIKQLC